MTTTTHVGKEEETETERSIQLRSADPSAPVENQLWINKTQNKLKTYKSGVVIEISSATVSADFPTEGYRNYVSEAPQITPPNTEIEGRKDILDNSQSLKLAMGIERIDFSSHSLVEDEFGPAGEPVRELDSRDERIRLIGSGWHTNNALQGTLLRTDGVGDKFEITFYGTGLNILGYVSSGTRDIRATVDGGAQGGSSIWVNGASNVLTGRGVENNTPIPVVSGLSLGIHTVSLELFSSSFQIWGCDIIREASQVINGGFSTGDLTGWTDTTVGTGTTVVNGSNQIVLHGDTGTNGGSVIQTFDTVAGKQYTIKWTQVDGNANSSVGAKDGDTGSPLGGAIANISGAAAGNRQFSFTAASGKTRLTVQMSSHSNPDTTMDNFSFSGDDDLVIAAGDCFIEGSKVTLSAAKGSAYAAGISGAKGARVVKYINDSGVISQSVQEVDASELTLASADHSNEEGRRVTYKAFGRNNNFQTLDSSVVAQMAFTLDDGTTTLSGNDVQTNSSDGVVGLSGAGDGDYWILTFVGTGLDLILTDGQLDRECELILDGVSLGNITDFDLTLRRQKIVSGLPYGTHTLKFIGDHPSNAAKDLIILTDFIIYQPKKPSIPSNACELDDYNVLADYVANTDDGLLFQATGIISKMSTREMIYVGAWAYANHSSMRSGYNISTSTNGAYLEYSFYGTGVDTRFDMDSGTATISIDGSTDLSAYTTSIYQQGTGSATFTAATGVISGSTGSTTSMSGAVISGLPLGFHTIKFQKSSSGGGTKVGSFDIITPIYRPGFSETAKASAGSRALSPIVPELNKADIGDPKAWIIYNGTNNRIIDSYNIAGLIDKSTGIHRVYFEKRFKHSPYCLGTASENRVVQFLDGRTDGNSAEVLSKATLTGSTDSVKITAVFYGELEDE